MRESSGHIGGVGGLKLYYRTWEPDEVRGCIVLVHGAGEHVGRYEHVAAWFADRGYAVWAMDHRGHGQSQGQRMHVDRFYEYLTDLNSFVRLVTSRHGAPAMIGHSMGGLIAYRYAIAYPESIRALVLSSPWFRTAAKINPLQRALAPLMSALLPRLRLSASTIEPEKVTRNPRVHQRDRSDPLIARTTTPRWFIECTRAAEACHITLQFPARLPVFFAVAGTDYLVDPEASRELFERVPGDRKVFKLYPEKYHEIFNDPGCEEVLAEVYEWLRAQGPAHA